MLGTLTHSGTLTKDLTIRVDFPPDQGSAIEPILVIPPAPNRRAIVSVAFSAKDFQTVGEAARQADMTLSAYIRRAAVDKAWGNQVGGKKA